VSYLAGDAAFLGFLARERGEVMTVSTAWRNAAYLLDGV
jgi:hypothetical protein